MTTKFYKNGIKYLVVLNIIVWTALLVRVTYDRMYAAKVWREFIEVGRQEYMREYMEYMGNHPKAIMCFDVYVELFNAQKLPEQRLAVEKLKESLAEHGHPIGGEEIR